jgi:hypothetical protein
MKQQEAKKLPVQFQALATRTAVLRSKGSSGRFAICRGNTHMSEKKVNKQQIILERESRQRGRTEVLDTGINPYQSMHQTRASA